MCSEASSATDGGNYVWRHERNPVDGRRRRPDHDHFLSGRQHAYDVARSGSAACSSREAKLCPGVKCWQGPLRQLSARAFTDGWSPSSDVRLGPGGHRRTNSGAPEASHVQPQGARFPVLDGLSAVPSILRQASLCLGQIRLPGAEQLISQRPQSRVPISCARYREIPPCAGRAGPIRTPLEPCPHPHCARVLVFSAGIGLTRSRWALMAET